MICKFCESEIPDNSVICPECKNNVAEEKTPEFKPEFMPTEAPKNKKPTGKIVGAIAGVITVAAAVLLCINLFGGSYLKRVERKAIKTTSIAVSKLYGQMLENNKNQTGAAKGTVDINIGDEAIELIEEAAGDSLDLSFLKNISLDMDINTKDTLAQAILTLNINDYPVVDADIIADKSQNSAYLALKSLNDAYLKAELSQSTAFPSMTDTADLPSEKEVRKIVEKYLNMALDRLDKYEKSYTDLTAGTVTKQYRTVTVAIDAELAKTIITDFVSAAKEDADLKKLIVGLAKMAAQDGDKVYNDFITGADKFVGEMQLLSSDELLYMTSYVDSKRNIVGRKFALDQDTKLEYYLLRHGDEFGAKLSVPDSLAVITAMGTIKKTGINAEITTSINGTNAMTTELVDLKLKKGTVRITPAKAAADLLVNNPLENAYLEFSYDTSGEERTLGLDVIDGDEVFLGISISAKESQNRDITLPPSELVYDYSESQEWLLELDTGKLFNALKEAGMSNDMLVRLLMLL